MTRLFRYNKQAHTVDQLPEMNDPSEDTDLKLLNESYYNDVCSEYYKHLSTLLTSLPVSGEVDWEHDQVLEEGKDLEIVNQNHPHPLLNPTDKVIVKNLGGGASEFFAHIAIPLTSKL